jgi:hypothetical protein
MNDKSEDPADHQDAKAVEARWSFDLKKMREHLDGGDELQVIVRGQLYLEHGLIELLSEAMRYPEATDLRRLPYNLKIDLCVGLGVLSKVLVPPMNKVNEFRNRVAHNLNYAFTEQDKRDFYNCYPKFGQTLVLERGNKREDLPSSRDWLRSHDKGDHRHARHRPATVCRMEKEMT